MRNMSHDIDEIIQKMNPDSHEFAQRQAFLEIGETDCQLLHEVHAKLAKRQHAFVSTFYDHLSQFPPLREFLDSPEVLARLKQTQAAYFERLTNGEYGDDYVRNRLRVGVMHQRIGLEPQWYIGAYRKYLSGLMSVLRDLFQDEPDKFFPTYDALLKIVCFDMSLALDTYIHSDRHEILRLKNYAEQIVGSMPAGLMVIDRDGRIRTVNHAIRDMFSLDKHGIPEGKRFSQLLSNQLLNECIEQGLAQQDYQNNLVITLHADASRLRYLRCKISHALLEEQNLLLLLVEDITERMQARAQLYESEERFRAAFGQAAVGLGEVCPDGRWLRVNRKLQEIIGYSEQELLQLSIRELTLPEDRHLDQVELSRLLRGETQNYSTEKRYIHKNGTPVWVKVTVAPMQRGNGQASFITVIEDIMQRKRFESELQRLAHHDPLTSLPNRNLMKDRLDQAVAHVSRVGRHVAVMFIDLDRFKNINDSLGHSAGDEVIVEVARRLARSVRDGDTVARLGGDEFVIVLSDVAREGDVALFAQKILDSLFVPIVIQGEELSLGGSIGISLYPKDGKDGVTLLKNADAAMYRAKALGRNNYQFYAQEMNAKAFERLKVEGGLRHALERNEFVLHYQPQMDLASGRMVGVEALLRWQPPGTTAISPADFIPIAEESGLIVPIGEWVLRTACAQHVAWKETGFPEVRMAVNLSARQFRQKGLEQMIARVLQETGCKATCLELEITESVIMDDPESATETLKKLSDMGVQLSIDDFGTGYSSLSYLKRFPIHLLKIDRSFVSDITTDPDDAAIVKGIIALAQSMKLKIIAEGVETTEQLEFLRKQQCDYMQGYYFSKPRLPAQLQEFMAKWVESLPPSVKNDLQSVVSCK